VIDTDSIALISAFTALCAVVLGPLVSLWAERNRTKVAVLSVNRQAWINELRDLIAELLSSVAYLNVTRHKDSESDERHLKLERLLLVHMKIGLMLNPKEDDHQALLAAIQKLVRATTAPHSDATSGALKTGQEELHKLAQVVLKREWERVKRSE
jgi:hypothetical protein